MSKNARVVTPVGTVAFPALFEPETNPNNPGGPAKFSTMLVFRPGTDLSDVEALIDQTAREKWGDDIPKNFRNPIRDGEEKAQLGGAFVEGSRFMTAKTKFRPTVVDNEVKEIIDPSDIYPGCEARMQVSAFAYDQSGNKGVTLMFGFVQKVRDGERIGGAPPASTVFSPVDADDLL